MSEDGSLVSHWTIHYCATLAKIRASEVSQSTSGNVLYDNVESMSNQLNSLCKVQTPEIQNIHEKSLNLEIYLILSDLPSDFFC